MVPSKSWCYPISAKKGPKKFNENVDSDINLFNRCIMWSQISVPSKSSLMKTIETSKLQLVSKINKLLPEMVPSEIFKYVLLVIWFCFYFEIANI